MPLLVLIQPCNHCLTCESRCLDDMARILVILVNWSRWACGHGTGNPRCTHFREKGFGKRERRSDQPPGYMSPFDQFPEVAPRYEHYSWSLARSPSSFLLWYFNLFSNACSTLADTICWRIGSQHCICYSLPWISCFESLQRPQTRSTTAYLWTRVWEICRYRTRLRCTDAYTTTRMTLISRLHPSVIL